MTVVFAPRSSVASLQEQTEAELRLLDCREKLFELKTLARQVKKGK